MSRVLHLTLKKKWFDMIASGEKKEEYREQKLFWWKRLCKVGPARFSMATILSEPKGVRKLELMRTYDTVCFRRGYAKNAPTLTVECLGIDIGPAKPEWSDNWQGDVFRIKLGTILSTTNT